MFFVVVVVLIGFNVVVHWQTCIVISVNLYSQRGNVSWGIQTFTRRLKNVKIEFMKF